MPLLDVPVGTLTDALLTSKRAFTAEYRTLGLDAALRNNLLFPLATIVGRLNQQLRLQAREFASQATPFGATGSNIDAWLAAAGIQIPPPATATGSVNITATDTTVPTGTLLASAGGETYTTDAQAIFVGTDTIEVAVTATAIGSQYNRAAGEILDLSTADDAVDPNAVVVLINGGTGALDDQGKQLLLQSSLGQLQGVGTGGWYRTLILAQDSQLNEVYVVEAGQGAGTIALYPTNRLTAGQEPYEVNVASAGQIASLQAYIEDEDVRLVNDRPFVLALVLNSIDFNITITPNDAATQAAVTLALGNRLAEDYTARGYTIANSELNAAVGNAPGVISHTINDIDGGGPSVDVTALVGELSVLGTITFA